MSQQQNNTLPGALGTSASPKTHATTQAAEHKGGLPQLNTDDFEPQLIWLALTFGALYWIMSRVALPRIADVMEKRRDHIATDIDAATQFKQQSEAAEVAYKSDLAEAKNKAHAIAQETRDKLNADTDQKRAEVDQKINASLVDAEQRINIAKGSALTEINVIASTTTKEIVDHLIGNKVSDQDLAAALKSIAAR